MVSSDVENRDILPYLVCRHMCVMLIEATEVKSGKNAAMLGAYKEKMGRWESLPKSTCSGNPMKAATHC